MTDVKKLKIGVDDPKAVLYGNDICYWENEDLTFERIVPKDNSVSAIYTEVPGQWQINNGWEVEILSPKKIAIKKFKIDTWGLRYCHPEGLSRFKWRGRKIRATGVDYLHKNVIRHTAGSDVPDGFANAYGGSGGYNVYWYPGLFTSGHRYQGFVIGHNIGYKANDNERDDSFQLGKHPWDVNTSLITDGVVGSSGCDGGYCGFFIGLFGGVQNATGWHVENGEAYREYDISDHPVIVELDGIEDDSKLKDVAAIECWDAYVGNELVYHKDKTAQNYWAEYGFLAEIPKKTGSTSPYTHYRVGSESLASRKYTVSPITDFEEFMTSHNVKGSSYVSWTFCRPDNSDFWTPVKEWYKTHKVCMEELLSYDSFGQGLFAQCTCDELELTFTKIKPNEGDQFMYAHQLIAGSSIKKLTINVDPDCRVSSLNSFCRASGIEHLMWNGTPPLAHDLSHMFEGCNNVQSIPDCILWDTPLNNPTNLTATFAGCSKLPRIDCQPGMMCTNDFAPIAFNGCSSLVYVEPIINLINADPTTYAYHWTWGSCSKLENLRLKNLKGVWRFDGSRHASVGLGDFSNGDLLALSLDCIYYMFDNAQEAPSGEVYELYCPSTWEERILPEWVDTMKAKGWNIYIGGQLYKNINESFLNSGWSEDIYVLDRTITSFVINNRVTPQDILHFNLSTTRAVNLYFTVTGLQAGDILKIRDFDGNETLSVTSDGRYEFNDNREGVAKGFILMNPNLISDKNVTIKL